MACTTILVGKNATYDGSTLVARDVDSGSTSFNPQKFIVVQPSEQPKVYKSVISKVEIPLPENPMRYTMTPNAIDTRGIWGSCGVNSLNVSMSATETITSNTRVQAADPLVPGGIGEEDMVTILLPYITSARDGVIRLGKYLEEYGTYEKNAIAFQDVNEIWWLETIGGHHWIAKRVPDEAYVVAANQFGIDYFDLDDAFGEQKEHMCSADLKEFIEKYHLDLAINFEEENLEEKKLFNARLAFGSHTDADHTYNTPRVWVLQRYFNPNSNFWDGMDADYRPDSDDMPWFRVPEKKITIEDIKYALSNHYQGTPYDPYGKYGDNSYRGMFRPIAVNRNSFLGLVQIRPYMPEAIRSVEWLALSSNAFNAMLPFYVNIDKTPEYLANTTAKVTTDNFYWTNRLVAALSDSHYRETSNIIEQYQIKLESKCGEIINKFDEKMKNLSYEEATKVCEEANEEIANEAREETDSLLDKILYTASRLMKNGFARSDA